MKEWIVAHKKWLLIGGAVVIGLWIILKLQANSSASSADTNVGGYGSITLGTPIGTGSTSFGSGAANMGGTGHSGTSGTSPVTSTGSGSTTSSSAPADTGNSHPSGSTPKVPTTVKAIMAAIVGEIKPPVYVGGPGHITTQPK